MVLDQDERTNRLSVIVSFIAWALISALLFARMWRLWGLNEISGKIGAALYCGGILTFIVVSLPFRVLQNVIQPERRRTRIGETVMCVVTFLTLVYLVYAMIVSYPPDW
jgi:hypothetical protein